MRSEKSVLEESKEIIRKESESNNMISARKMANIVINRGGFGMGKSTRIHLKKKSVIGSGLVLSKKNVTSKKNVDKIKGDNHESKGEDQSD